MGERKGTNKYYPPDYDPSKGGLNKFMGTHALRERARKLHLGILIIRFEMPYNIWCEGCKNHIGMGVRYNAEKTKVGMYYSTPIYQFRMKCHLCDNHFEMKTDPANLDYVIVNGARRQENRWDPTENGQVVPDDKRVIRQLADDAMFKLQHGKEDQTKLTGVTPTLAKLEDLQERWKDDYMANRALRDMFRTKKKELKLKDDKDSEILKRNSLNITLLEETEDDAKIASLIRLQPTKSSEERQAEIRKEIEKKSAFPLAETIRSPETPISIFPGVTNNKDETRTTVIAKQRMSLGIALPSAKNSEIKTVNISRNFTAARTNVEKIQSLELDSSKTVYNDTVPFSSVEVLNPAMNSSVYPTSPPKDTIIKGLNTESSSLLRYQEGSDQKESSSLKPSTSTGLSLISCDYDYSSSGSGSESPPSPSH